MKPTRWARVGVAVLDMIHKLQPESWVALCLRMAETLPQRGCIVTTNQDVFLVRKNSQPCRLPGGSFDYPLTVEKAALFVLINRRQRHAILAAVLLRREAVGADA
jgi:hypothetical protein